MLEYTSISELCQAAQEQGVSLSQLVLADQAQQMELSPSSCWTTCSTASR